MSPASAYLSLVSLVGYVIETPKKRLVSICSILGLGILGWLPLGLTYAAEAVVEYEKQSAPAPEAQPVILKGAEKVYEVEGRYAPNGEYDSGGRFDPIGAIGPRESPRQGRVEHGDYDSEAFAPAYQAPSKSGDVSQGIH